MASRESSVVTAVSGTNKTYPAGSAASTANRTVINISQSKDFSASTNSKLANGGSFNGHAVEVYADGAVWDTVNNAYLFPGRDYNPGDVQRK